MALRCMEGRLAHASKPSVARQKITQAADRSVSHKRPPWLCVLPRARAGKYVERCALPYVFKYLVTELAAMNIRCSLDLKS